MTADGHHTHADGHGHGDAQSRGHGDAFQSDRMAAYIEAEGELAQGVTGQAIAICRDTFEQDCVDVRRIVDLGCGPGVATAALATAFGYAAVVGVDGSRAMLERAARRAERGALAARIELQQHDLDGGLADLGAFDLVWAANVLHHTRDEPAALARMTGLLAPQGLLCLLERATPIAIHPANELGRPGIWERVSASVPAMHGAAYAELIEQSGLQLVGGERTLTDTMIVAAGDATAQPVFERYLHAASTKWHRALEPGDIDALAAAARSSADIEWGDTRVTSTRALFVARHASERANLVEHGAHG